VQEPIRTSWRDNEGVTALRQLSEAIDTVAAAIPERDDVDEPIEPGRSTGLPLQNIPAHVAFARSWEERRQTFLARRLHRNCPICDVPPGATWFETQDGYRYVRCRVCEMIYIPEFLPLTIWDEYFASMPQAQAYLRQQLENSVSDAAAVRDRDRFGRYLTALRSHGAQLKGHRLLDIGTFTGASLRVAAEHGIVAEGIEGLAEAVRFSRERFPDLRVRHVTAEKLDVMSVTDPFDLVTMWETLEHTVDPLHSLRLASGLLKPGGWLAVTVPNARNVQFSVLREFCFFAYGGYNGIGHINMFSPASLKRALSGAGFDLVSLTTEFGTDWRQVLYYLREEFERIHCYRKLVEHGDSEAAPGPELQVLLNWLSPALTRLENASAAGPIMLALAQRPFEPGGV
jgi:SAM-dependent methyltransferase